MRPKVARLKGGAGVSLVWLALICETLACDSQPEAKPDAATQLLAKVDVAEPEHSSAILKFREVSGEKSATLGELERKFGVKEIESQDDYYGSMKRYRAIPLAPLIREYFKHPDDELKGAKFLFQASDGFAVRLDGAKVLNGSAYLAVADLDHREWQPIGEQGANPGPLYMVWEGSEFADKEKFPRPWALAQIELLTGADGYMHTRPSSGFGADDLAKKGYEIFDLHCLRCHSINQEGGSLGPELNVPQNILAYRPEKQVREYIKNPRTFRYSAMPPHPDFGEEELDALIAYLKLMGDNQHDPHDKDSQKAE